MQHRELIKHTLGTVVRRLALEAPHRTALADRVCAQFDFRDARGQLQRSTCLSAQRTLESAARLNLPDSRNAGRRSKPRGLGAQAFDVPSHVVHIGAIKLVEVCDDGHRRIRTGLLRRVSCRRASSVATVVVRGLSRASMTRPRTPASATGQPTGSAWD